MRNLDTSPLNQLGKNILSPALEARLLDQGYTFARRLPSGGLLKGKRALSKAAQDMLDDAAQLQPDAHRYYPVKLVVFGSIQILKNDHHIDAQGV